MEFKLHFRVDNFGPIYFNVIKIVCNENLLVFEENNKSVCDIVDR